MTELEVQAVLDVARKRFIYDELTGIFRYAVETCHSNRGDIAGSKTSAGYLEVTINRKRIHLHRLAWLLCYGYLPDHHIDHRDGDKANNAIKNLREASPSENGQNRVTKNTNNTSGHTGVWWHAQIKKWVAEIMVNRKKITVGYFTDIQEAADARAKAKEKFHNLES